MDSEPLARAARRYAPVAVAVALLALVAVVTATSGLRVHALSRAPGTPRSVSPTLPTQSTATPMAGLPPTPGPVPDVSHVLRLLFVLACLAIGALLALIAVRLAHRSGWRRATTVPDGPALAANTSRPVPEVLDAAVAAGLAELADDSDPRGAVINAWVRLEQVAEQVGAVRAPSDTPADLATRLLAEHAVPTEVLDRLAALYRAARYSPRPVDDERRVAALDALGAVQAALRQPMPAA